MKRRKFIAAMFITELPYLDTRKPIYQINVDLLNIPFEDEEVFSATVLYHVLKKEITFAGVNNESVKAPGKIAKKRVGDLPAALRGAVAMARRSWGPKIWAELAKPENQ